MKLLKLTVCLPICLIAAMYCLSPNPAKAQATSGVSSDGKDFYVGYVLPSFNRTSAIPGFRDPRPLFGVYILVSSYTDNVIHVSYFDSLTGIETVPQTYKVNARTGVQILLDTNHMRMNQTGDIAENTACHITADQPINVQYFSTGACSGGSYLSLATPALGKKYVVASYNDNNGQGAAINSGAQGENSGGFALIIAAFDKTNITITPNGTTEGGHKGAFGTTPVPYSVSLNRGQCYWVKGDGKNTDNDLSGSVIVANKPIAVLAGHENAFLGDVGARYVDARDFMIEQLIPADFWDATGYVSIPLKDSQPVDETNPGFGENYRVYTDNPNGARVVMENSCVSGDIDFNTTKLAYPTPEKYNEGCPLEFHSIDGHKFGIMLYDLRGQGNVAPYPSESMMSIVPMSSWKTSYMFYVAANTFEVLQNYYINLIALRNDIDKGNIQFSFNGASSLQKLTALQSQGTYTSIPSHPELKAMRFAVHPGSYFFTNTRDAFKNPDLSNDAAAYTDTAIIHGGFIIYHYGMRAMDVDRDLGDFDGDDFFFSYANPVGASLSSGDKANFKVTIDSQCGKWNFCVTDNRKIDHGIRSITLLNDPMGIQYSPEKRSINFKLDPSIDPNNFGEVELPGTDSVVCFSAEIIDPLVTGYGAVLITDNAGNKQLTELHYEPAKLSVTPGLPIKIANVLLGKDSCLSVILKNSEQLPHIIQTANFSQGKSFSVSSITPKLPVTLTKGDSVTVKICYTAMDTSIVNDTLKLDADCISIPVQFSGSGGVGFISAPDLNFGMVDTERSFCNDIFIRNVGTQPFTLTKNWTMKGSKAFTFKNSSALPVVIQPKQSFIATICYEPLKTSSDTAEIDWNTDIASPFSQSVKSFTKLTGKGELIAWDSSQYHQTVNCDDSSIIRRYLINYSLPSVHVNSVSLVGKDASQWRIIGDQLGLFPMTNFNMHRGDSIWVDLVFKPDVAVPLAQRYADRKATLVANMVGEADLVADLTGSVIHAIPTMIPDSIDFGVVQVGTVVSRDLLLQNLGTAPTVLTAINPISYPIIDVTGIAVGDSLLPNGIRPKSIEIKMQINSVVDTTFELIFYFQTLCDDAVVVKLHVSAKKSGVKEVSTQENFSIRPNPANGNSIILSIQESSESAEINIFDVLGREVYKRNIPSLPRQFEIPINHLSNGIYYARISSGGKILSQKFEVAR